MYSSSLILTSVNCNDDQDSVGLELNKIIQDEEYTPTIIWNFTSHFLKISKMLEDCHQDFFHPEWEFCKVLQSLADPFSRPAVQGHDSNF